MNGNDNPRQVQVRAPASLVEQLDAIADLSERDRADVLLEAIREYVADTTEDESFRTLVAEEFYDDQLDGSTVEQLVGTATAQRLRLLKQDLEGEPLDLVPPESDVDVY